MSYPATGRHQPAAFGPALRVVLGPTNTGKTHLALERMLAHQSGMIGLPLRLLAREVYDRCLAGDFGRVHRADVALITGEEKILPPKARYFICTTESMPVSRAVEFVAIDECQLAADPERGHIFTDRILHARGTAETILLGAATMAPILDRLLPKVQVETRERLSQLNWAGSQKLSRLPRRSAITAFSAENVYAIAEIIRQQRGGAAVVMGGLSPRTRNAQVAMYQSGEVDFLVATDAIGMGLNMDVDHVAFAQRRKFDGRRHRELTPAELAQIAGRAGRHKTNGSFGVTGDLDLFDETLVEQIETHRFEPVKGLMWRNPNLNFSSLDALLASLEAPVPREGLLRAPVADDLQALRLLSRDPETRDLAQNEAQIRLLWEVAQIPDFRKTTMGEHSALIGEIFGFLSRHETGIPADWLAERINRCDRSDGDLDTLSMRLAHIRTWTYIANRSQWVAEPQHWQEMSRAVEDRLSDALHMKLMGKFVDRKASALMRRLQGVEKVEADIEDSGDIMVAGEYMGRLTGLHVQRDPRLKSIPVGPARAAVEKAVGEALRLRAGNIAFADDTAFTLNDNGEIIWQQATIGKLRLAGQEKPGDALAYLHPQIELLADEILTGELRQRAEARLTLWLRDRMKAELAPLFTLQESDGIDGLGRGLAFQLLENKGSLPRIEIADMLGRLDQPMRRQLRRQGIRFGAYNVFIPALLKPAAARLLALLASAEMGRNLAADLQALPSAGLTSVKRAQVPNRLYRAAGYYPTRNRAIRLDMLERLADLIRPLLNGEAEQEAAKAQAPPQPVENTGKTTPAPSNEANETRVAPENETPQAAVQDEPASEPASETADEAPAPSPTDKPTDKLAEKPRRIRGFQINEQMMSIMGCGSEDMAEILSALGYQSFQPKETNPPVEAADANGAANEEIQVATTEAEQADAAPVYWRPRARHAGKNSGKNTGHAQKRGAARKADRQANTDNGKPDKNSRDKRSNKNTNGKNQNRKQASKQASRPAIDPDSPFAVLSQLQNKGKELQDE